MKRIIKIGMICLTVSVFPGTALRAASDLTIGDILKWIDKHRTELTADGYAGERMASMKRSNR